MIKKNQESVVIVGHQDTLNIIFEHKPSWSKVSIDDEIPVALALGHIKYMMDPFQAEFGRVKSYTKWKGIHTYTYDQKRPNLDYLIKAIKGQVSYLSTKAISSSAFLLKQPHHSWTSMHTLKVFRTFVGS